MVSGIFEVLVGNIDGVDLGNIGHHTSGCYYFLTIMSFCRRSVQNTEWYFWRRRHILGRCVYGRCRP